jgi:hypothetical protein
VPALQTKKSKKLNAIHAPIARSILDEPIAPGLGAEPRTCILVEGLIGRAYDFDAFLTLDLLLRDLARHPLAAPPTVALLTTATFLASEETGLERLPALDEEVARLGAELVYVPVSSSAARTSAEAHAWLLGEGFSTVVAIGGGAALHWALTARRLGFGHERTRFVEILHAPTLWSCEQRGSFANSTDYYARDFLERGAAAHADRVLTFHAGIRPWLARRGWPMDRIETVEPGFIAHPSDGETFPRDRSGARKGGSPGAAPRRLCFIGNIDDRYGLDCFLEALEIVAKPGDVKHLEIDFIGMSGPGAAEHPATAIAGVMGALPFEWRYVVADAPRVVLRRIGKSDLVVCCSAVAGGELLPAYCAAYGLPLLSTLGGLDPGNPLAGPFDVRTARSVARDLRAALRPEPAEPLRSGAAKANGAGEVLSNGAAKAREKIPEKTAEEPGIAERLLSAPTPRPAPEPEAPFVSVILCHEDAPGLLHQALYALGRQTHPGLEVIVVDNASSFEGTLAYLRQIEPLFDARGWRLVRRAESADAAALRNEAVAMAQGDLLVMLEADGVARPDLIASLVRAAEVGRLDAVSCFAARIEGDDFPVALFDAHTVGADVAPLGAAIALGAHEEAFTCGAVLYRRAAIVAAGGYCAGEGGGDHELLARLALKGARIDVVPETLWLARAGEPPIGRSIQAYRRVAAVVETYEAAAGESLKGLFQLALEQQRAPDQARGRGVWSRAALAPESAGAAIAEASAEKYPLALARCALEAGRPETALELAARELTRDPPATLAQDALEVARKSLRAALPINGAAALELLEAAGLTNLVRVDLAGALIETAAERGEGDVLAAALDILAACDTADPEAFAALAQYEVDGVDAALLEDAVAEWARLPATYGLQHLALRALLSHRGPKGGPSGGRRRQAWRKRLQEISALYG